MTPEEEEEEEKPLGSGGSCEKRGEKKAMHPLPSCPPTPEGDRPPTHTLQTRVASRTADRQPATGTPTSPILSHSLRLCSPPCYGHLPQRTMKTGKRAPDVDTQ